MKRSSDVIRERRRELLSVIEREQDISINRLNTFFDVSVLTLRRDLDTLVEQGLVQRYHGGVRFAGPVNNTPYFDEKLMSNRTEKQQIAHYVASIIPVGSNIFMNGGTSTLEIISQLKNHSATIITNNVMAFDAAGGGNCNIICTGGEYNSICKTYCGELSSGIIQKTLAEYCILGVNGISSQTDVTTSIYAESIINSLMAQRCKGPIILAADASKIGRSFCFVSLKLEQVDELITTSAADQRELDAIAAKGVKITLADKL